MSSPSSASSARKGINTTRVLMLSYLPAISLSALDWMFCLCSSMIRTRTLPKAYHSSLGKFVDDE